MAIDLNSLRIVLAVAEWTSYTRAAQKIGITQPAVSRRVAALERALGTRLFRRDGYRVVPTDACAAVCERARQMVALADELPLVAQHFAAEPTGSVAIGLPSTLGDVLLAPLAQSYRARYPGVYLRVEQGYAADLSEMLLTKQVDVAIVYGRQHEPMIEATPLIHHELGLVFPRAWKRRSPNGKALRAVMALKDTVGLPLILTSGTQSIRRLVDDAYREAGVLPRVEMEVNSLAFLKAAVREGLGATFLASSGFHGQHDSELFGFARITKPIIPWTMYLAVRKQGQLTLAAKMLIRTVRTIVQDLITQKKWDGELAEAGKR